MKHLLSLCIAVYFIINSVFAQQNDELVIRTIKGKDYIIYKVKPGDSWESIAQKFKVLERTLIDENPQTNGTLKGVNTLKVPASGMAGVTTKVTKEKEAEVQENTLPKFGDNFKNAKPTNVKKNEVASNESSLPKFGDNINEPKSTAEKPKLYGQEIRTEFRGANSLIVYKVGAGDVIEKIAKFYNSSVSDISSKNNLVGNTLTPGKIIKIPVVSETSNPMETPIVKEVPKPITPSTGTAEVNNAEMEKPIVTKPTINENNGYNNASQIPNTTNLKANVSKSSLKGQEIRTEYRGANSLIVYKVGNGDKIENIAKYYNCTVNEISSKNNLVNNTLTVGKIIKIPVVRPKKEIMETTTDAPMNVAENKEVVKLNTEKTKEEPKVAEAILTTSETTPIFNEIINESNADLKPNELKLGDYTVIKKLGRYYIKHLVISGEDLSRIAKENYSTNVKIVNTNNLKTPKLKTGQILLIPTNKVTLLKLTGLDIDKVEAENNKLLAEQAKKLPENSANENVYSKTDNDTINQVIAQNGNDSKKENKPMVKDSSLRYNWGDPLLPPTDKLDTNAKKTIEDNAKDLNLKEVHANASAGDTKESFTHLVQNGETIEGIAKKYKISPSDIANWNNLYQSRIRVGQYLIVNLERARKPYLALNTIDPELQKTISKSDQVDRIKHFDEKGLCYFSDDRFIGISHKNIPIGTLILITSTENYKKIYVRITGVLENNDPDIILQVDKNIAKQLALNSSLSNIIISYNLVE
ncbi:MAG: LysM peptidoglycan-binding domain-containing protein [Bacteroidia bacterium]|nr:LysM peptidoglycan-binding domain-containing protein [Bacteroidia bacterium]